MIFISFIFYHLKYIQIIEKKNNNISNIFSLLEQISFLLLKDNNISNYKSPQTYLALLKLYYMEIDYEK